MNRFAVAMVTLMLCFLFLSPGHGQARLDTRAQTAARSALAKATFEATARVLTIYDRAGKVVRTLGERAVYGWPAFSPDGTRLAVSKRDVEAQRTDVWVFDLATGTSRQITSDPAQVHTTPMWSPDGRQIAYASNPGGSPGIYRMAADGTGAAELLYEHPTAPTLTDWSADGQFLTFHATPASYGNTTRIYLLSLTPPLSGARKAVEVGPAQVHAGAARFSPGGRWLAYSSSQSGRWEVWVRPFDAANPGKDSPAAGPRQVSNEGGWCTCAWRQDGKEMYYVAPDGDVMALEVNAGSSFTSGKPRVLFKAPENIKQDPLGLSSVSRDGQQFLFAIPPKPRGTRPLRQLTVFDRQGKVVRTLGQPGRFENLYGYTKPVLSPDGTRVAAFLEGSLHVFDVATGRSVQILSSAGAFDQSSPVWSPDGRHIAFFSFRDGWGYIYRVASDGTGSEEQLFRHAFDVYAPPLTDWSPDGRFLSFDAGTVPWVLPLSGERRSRELMREEFNIYSVRFSPDSRFAAYTSDESGRNEVYVRPFDATRLAVGDRQWQVSTAGGLGLVQWRQDGTELYYLAADGGVMAVQVTTTPAFRAGTRTRLFQAPGTFQLEGVFEREGTNAPECSDQSGGLCETGSVSRNGQRFVFSLPLPPKRTEVRLAPATLAQYTGTYVLDRLDWVVTLEENQLMIQRTGRAKAPLFAESETRFFLKTTNGDFEFVRDDHGDVAYLFLYRGGAPLQLIRSSPVGR